MSSDSKSIARFSHVVRGLRRVFLRHALSCLMGFRFRLSNGLRLAASVGIPFCVFTSFGMLRARGLANLFEPFDAESSLNARFVFFRFI